MLDIKFIREHANEVKMNIQHKRMAVDVDELLRLDDVRLKLLREVEDLRRERNEVAEKMKTAKPDERPVFIMRGKEIKDEIAKKDAEMEETEKKWHVLLLQVPNMTHPASPIGASDADNKQLKVVGEIPTFDFKPLSHVELAAKHDLIDFERAAKVTGAKFYYLKGFV